MKLIDIFPKINKNVESGLVVDNGICTDLDINKHTDYLGIADDIKSAEDFCFFFPEDVVEIDEDTNMFNTPGYIYSSLVFTTNMKQFSPYSFMCRGFKNVYIINAKTEDVVFHSEKFCCDGVYDFLSNSDIWECFSSDYVNNPIETMKNPLYFDPDVDFDD